MGDGSGNWNEKGFNNLVEKWFEYPHLFHEAFQGAAKWAQTEIANLRAKLAEYDGATVVEVDDKTDCLFCDGELSYCHLDDDGNGCVMPFARFHGSKLTDCPLRRGAVIVKMKKEQ